MKQKALVVICYSILLLTASLLYLLTGGGLIVTFLTHDSFMYILGVIASTILMFISSTLMVRGKIIGYYLSLLFVIGLFSFFTYRYWVTNYVMPAGVIAIITGCLLIYLLLPIKKEEVQGEDE